MAENYYKKYHTRFLDFKLYGGTEELLIMWMCVIFPVANNVI